MATQSPSPPNSTQDQPQNSATELAQATDGDQQVAGEEAIKQISTPSVFVNSEPVREEQVQNAVKFLSHPKVRGSPIIYRRSFLEKKGLTKEEIDEAFRRVPDPPPSAQAPSTNQDGPVKSSSTIQPHAPGQTLQPTAASHAGMISSMGPLKPGRFHWYHAVLAVGVLAVSGAGTAVLIKNALVPRLKSWIRKVVLEEDNALVKKIDLKPSLAEEAAAAAKAAAAAAADVARASQEMLNSKNTEKRYFEELMNRLDVQVQEMKSMTHAIRRLEGDQHGASDTSLKQPYTNGKAEFDSRSARSSSPPASVEPSVAPHPKSYMDIMAMVQRGERPPNVRDINDLPPNPNQQPSNPRLAPRAKPWEGGHAQNSSSQVFQSQVNGEGSNSMVQDNGVMYQLDGDSSVPWWQRKKAQITEIEDEIKGGPYSVRTNAQPIQSSWVPPQPPPVVMPEAAEAIRRPKPSAQREQFADHQSVSHPPDASDELQRITKISESGGAVEINGGESGLSSSEIQEEQSTQP
ncbi:Pex14_N domain-containing protein [Cephalotus follicularis]|uniref:Peroxisomal membrane protein PEX14 n=1 Tax=Cephalotus follicularis TaxID=3775 RepID=A0A1Q3B701_CEPFO|nr:Pex14_N domain-containing protein [Cephalotus follicularis]